MRKILPFMLIGAVAACSLADDAETVTEAPQLEQRAVWSGNLTGTGSVAGTATITEYRAYFNADVALSGAAANRAHQWRIYAGTCAAPGAQFGPNQAYPNVTTNASGGAGVTRTIAGALDSTAAYNVRFSTATAPITIVACGNLQRS